MQFKQTTIPYEGREKYKSYATASSIARTISRTYGIGGNTGNGGNTGGGNQDDNGRYQTYSLSLSKTSASWKDVDIATGTVTDSIDVLGYVGTERVNTFVGDMSVSAATTNYGITGIPSGMTITITDNGTSGTVLGIAISSGMTEYSGELKIPVSVNISNKTWDANHYSWFSNPDKVMSMVLTYTWSVTISEKSLYTIDLDNESASINCDKDGIIYPESIPYVNCQATMYFGTKPVVDNVSWSLTIPLAQERHVQGITISPTGKLEFASNLKFDGSPIEITVNGFFMSEQIGKKVFTLTKAFPGEDGSSPTSYWLTFSANAIHVNKNTNPYTVSPSAVTIGAMMQVGNQTPTTATGVSIYYGYDVSSPATLYTGPISPDVSKNNLVVCLKKGTAVVDGNESIPILSDGINGQDGEDGKDGKDGKDGQSVYRLDLTNQAATINADSNGNILAGAVRPTCTAKLYYGSQQVTGVTYSISSKSTTTTGLTINASSGVLTFNSGSVSQPFNFNGNTLEITIQAKIGSVLYGEAIMTVSKAFAGTNGQNGQNATSYWLNLSADAIQVTSGNTANPSTITATGMKQIGEQNPTTATDCVIKWGYNTAAPSTTYSSAITVDKTKNYITFQMLHNNVQVDLETVPILHDGKNGADGQPGAQGRQGAAVRGPVKWEDQTTTRRFCNGTLTNASYPEDALWIDVIMRIENNVKKYYYCNTSYNGSSHDSWSTVSSKWTLVDQQFNFIATNLLLAQNAAIDFLTGNEIYLRDNNGNITAGAAGGNGISFWAGASEPSNANFQVDYNGNIIAKSGTFAGFVQMPYSFISDLSHSGSTSSGYYIADSRAYLIADSYSGSYGMGDGGLLMLPTPSAAYNGFTYHIIATSNIATKVAESTAMSVITPASLNLSASDFKVFTFMGTSNDEFSRLKFYGGHIVITCMPFHTDSGSTYKWICTDATGGVDCYGIKKFHIGGGGGYQGWSVSTSGETGTLSKSTSIGSNNYGMIGITTPGASVVKYTFSGNTNGATIYLRLDSESASNITSYSGSAGKTGTFTIPNAGSHTIYGYFQGTAGGSSNYVDIKFEKNSATNVEALVVSYNPVCGVSTIGASNTIARIYAEDNTSMMTRDNNAIYIDRR